MTETLAPQRFVFIHHQMYRSPELQVWNAETLTRLHSLPLPETVGDDNQVGPLMQTCAAHGSLAAVFAVRNGKGEYDCQRPDQACVMVWAPDTAVANAEAPVVILVDDHEDDYIRPVDVSWHDAETLVVTTRANVQWWRLDSAVGAVLLRSELTPKLLGCVDGKDDGGRHARDARDLDHRARRHHWSCDLRPFVAVHYRHSGSTTLSTWSSERWCTGIAFSQATVVASHWLAVLAIDLSAASRPATEDRVVLLIFSANPHRDPRPRVVQEGQGSLTESLLSAANDDDGLQPPQCLFLAQRSRYAFEGGCRLFVLGNDRLLVQLGLDQSMLLLVEDVGTPAVRVRSREALTTDPLGECECEQPCLSPHLVMLPSSQADRRRACDSLQDTVMSQWLSACLLAVVLDYVVH